MTLHPSANVISEVIDGEAVVIDLKDGCYYSFNESGSQIWSEIERGTEAIALVATIADRYGLTPDLLSEEVISLTDELVTAGIVVDDAASVSVAEAPASAAVQPFTTPTFTKYVDMQDLILLDPVHEVDEQQGWPLQRPPGQRVG